METLKQTLHNKIKRLKRQAEYQQTQVEIKHQEIIKYDSPGHLPLLIQYPNLHEHIHKCIEFGAADKKRRKEVIKVRTIRHLREELNSKYMNIFYAPLSTITCCHLDQILKQQRFITIWLLLQMHLFHKLKEDDKAKVPLGIPAVGKPFQTLQSFQELVTLLDHDFLVGMQQKLIPLVYLLINLSDMNDAFRNGQLSIFIYPQYQVGISSSTHMSDLNSLIQDNRFDGILKINSQIKPIWILLVDGEPNKNLRHIKNIFQYCGMFCNFNLDYLSIWTHAPGQSTYNPVKRNRYYTLIG
ncbi:uncharacterized protein LOC109428822 [Rhizophagus clarus]|uniref:Uncharacterized protein LOC109428822 n=1 Tax=Rhizophagus clarus TaxID=94130 RepID=A0A8H3KR55_9GLOM|nr:uncharacterized protein LOC109428822 [Rhizophagus clarus]